MSVADNLGYTADVGQPRAFFLDIYTQPGSVYEPMNVEFVMPETVLGNGVPAATICSVQMYYVGVYSVCAQSAYVNNYQISYLARFNNYITNKKVVYNTRIYLHFFKEWFNLKTTKQLSL